VIVVGLLLTFSRASVVALVVPLAAFLVRRQLLWLRRPTRTGLRRFALGVVGAVVVVVLVQKFFPITLGFFQQRLVDVVANPETVRAQLANPDMSPGIRVQIWRHILDFVSANPLTGAGFLGVWIIPSAKTGSAHNQYFDVLFRSGLPGFGMYLVLLFLLLRYLRRADQALFWGLVAVLIYGVFHETFKESQGAFVLAFLLGMFSESVRRRRRPESPIKTAALAAA
jgi:O-antigen ligase